MKGGFSGCSGIILYDTKDKNEKNIAVYGTYENNEILLREGTLEEMQAIKKQKEEPYKCDKNTWKVVVIIFLIMLIFLILMFFKCSFVGFLGWALVCIASYFPITVILLTISERYKEKEYKQLADRYHGCEHAALKLLSSEKEPTLENLKKKSIYDAECGTAYCGYLLFLIIELVILIGVFDGLGFLKIIGIVAVTIVLLFINIFNPLNPFLLLQYRVVAKPSEKEYLLAIAVINRLKELESCAKVDK